MKELDISKWSVFNVFKHMDHKLTEEDFNYLHGPLKKLPDNGLVTQLVFEIAFQEGI